MYGFALTGGFAAYCDLKFLSVFLRPQGTWNFWQNRHIYEPFGFTVTAGIAVALKSKTEKEAQ
jgi:hypothetical protein